MQLQLNRHTLQHFTSVDEVALTTFPRFDSQLQDTANAVLIVEGGAGLAHLAGALIRNGDNIASLLRETINLLPKSPRTLDDLGQAASDLYTVERPIGDVFPELANINPTFVENAGPGVNLNCLNVTICAQHILTGEPVSAVPLRPGQRIPDTGDLTRPFDALGRPLEPGTGSLRSAGSMSLDDIRTAMRGAGDGSVGFVVIQADSSQGVGHVTNVINRNNEVFFVDAQRGVIVDLNPNIVSRIQFGLGARFDAINPNFTSREGGQ